MLHPVRVPPASGSLPPSDVPSGNTLGSITRRSHKYPPDMQLTRQPHVRLVVTRILRPPHAARPAGRRNPPPRFRSASPPPGSPPTARREDAPRPGLRHHVRALHHASGPQDSRRDALGMRFGNVVRVVHIGGSRGHLRALRRQALSSSLPALPHSYRRLCSLVVPAGTLDPAPCGGKEHLSVLRSQNPLGNGFAKHLHRSGGATTPAAGGRAKSARGKPGSTPPTPASLIGGTCSPAPAIPAPSPALGRSRAVNR